MKIEHPNHETVMIVHEIPIVFYENDRSMVSGIVYMCIDFCSVTQSSSCVASDLMMMCENFIENTYWRAPTPMTQ